MAWTSPRTWVASEVVTASIMNAHVRDNLNAVNGYSIKTADESVTSSTTLQNDDHLFYTIGAAGTYLIDAWLIGTSAANAAGDIQVGFSFPTGTLAFSGIGPDPALASGTLGQTNWAGIASATSGTSAFGWGLSTSALGLVIRGSFIATGTGTLRLMWAQLSSSASASTLKAGSYMRVQQVA